ncbi:hypothetical protein [Halomonas dongshanensis]|uniref:Uncharacterized protein n=1 Tax=Halomonas dongshanensis TaxID=2890835 RepID=A0ABT2EIF8_9GAMM|nr:hypothetical protein [Halomonas dongshanensis]MCS2610895.1 hypothetical protein [Halomonas dongshanensis]
MKKTALFLTIVGAMATQGAFAQEQACTTPALMAASQSVQGDVENYANAQAQQGREINEVSAELEEIMSAADVESTLMQHQAELEMMQPGSDHEPSQALCDDMYAMFDRMQDELASRQ